MSTQYCQARLLANIISVKLANDKIISECNLTLGRFLNSQIASDWLELEAMIFTGSPRGAGSFLILALLSE